MISDSVDESAISLCFLLIQCIGVPLRINMSPDADREAKIGIAKLASANGDKKNFTLPFEIGYIIKIPSSKVPDKYLMILRAQVNANLVGFA